ncbi:MAG: 5'/3'-nucleotidase SurE [Candidatus Omnitrophota bacterium]
MKILLTNDDGVNAPGLLALVKEIKTIAEVIVIAPETERSAIGHAITLAWPLRVKKVFSSGKLFGYAVDGTPADCVKIALRTILKKRPALVISGINQGPNLGTDVIYSGTVSAATEAAILGVAAIAVSLASYKQKNFQPAAKAAKSIARYVLKHGLPYGTLLNVNVPALPQKDIKGYAVTRQGKSIYDEQIIKREDPRGHEYYWLTGKAAWLKERDGADIHAIKQKKISITPIHFDMTDYAYLNKLNSYQKIRLR